MSEDFLKNGFRFYTFSIFRNFLIAVVFIVVVVVVVVVVGHEVR